MNARQNRQTVQFAIHATITLSHKGRETMNIAQRYVNICDCTYQLQVVQYKITLC